MLQLIRAIIAPFPKSTFNNSAAPDEIIAAAIVESFAKDFDDWVGTLPKSFKAQSIVCHDTDSRIVRQTESYIKNEKKNICIASKGYRKGKSRDGDGLNPWHYHLDGLTVNKTPISNEAGQFICREYHRLKQTVDAAKAAANRVKAEIKRTEDAWNLAEKLLGKKRMPNGALVPATSFCETCVRHDGKPIETHNGIVYQCSGCKEKEEKCIPSTDSSGSASTTDVKSKTVKAAAPSVRRRRTVSTKSSTPLIPKQVLTPVAEDTVSYSQLLSPL